MAMLALALVLPTVGAQRTVTAQGPTSAQSAAPSIASGSGMVDHRLYDDLLRVHVKNGFVDYDALARRPELGRYLDAMASVRPETLTEDEQIAYWINVYNAATLGMIIDAGERESIRNVHKTFAVLKLKGPWSTPVVRVGSARYSLDEVHHRKLRQQFGESRVVFALTCGALSCPPLRSEAYTGDKLVDQLNDQTRRFLRGNARWNGMEGRWFSRSPIIRTFADDFGEGKEDIGRWFAPYFEGRQREQLMTGAFSLRVTGFDWRLNSVANQAEWETPMTPRDSTWLGGAPPRAPGPPSDGARRPTPP
jgi:hypothetical protein